MTDAELMQMLTQAGGGVTSLFVLALYIRTILTARFKEIDAKMTALDTRVGKVDEIETLAREVNGRLHGHAQRIETLERRVL